jgi:hypothetical protein
MIKHHSQATNVNIQRLRVMQEILEAGLDSSQTDAMGGPTAQQTNASVPAMASSVMHRTGWLISLCSSRMATKEYLKCSVICPEFGTI